MKNKRGFTLAEILGVVVVIGLLLTLIAPAIISRIGTSKNKAKETGYKLVYMATSQHIAENKPKYPSGRKYCIKISDLIKEGKLSSPVKEIDTGKTIDDYSVLVYIYSSGNEYYEIPTSNDECQNEASLPMIDFLVEPAVNQWTKLSKKVTIIYPSDSNQYKYKKDDLSWVSSSVNRPNITFDSNGELSATAVHKGITIKSNIIIDKIDKDGPNISFNPNSQSSYIKNGKKIIINVKDSGSGLKSGQKLSYQWSNSTSTPTSGWKTKNLSNENGIKEIKIAIPSKESNNLTGIYYLHVKSGIQDMVGNTSANKKSDAFYFDNTKPTITFSPNTQTTYTKSGKEVTVNLADSHSGLKKTQTISYKWTTSTSAPTSGWSTIKTTNSDGIKSTSVKIPASASNGLTGTYYLHIKGDIQDMTGNKVDDATSARFLFDNTAPTCSWSGESTTWTNSNRTIKVTGIDSHSGMNSSNKEKSWTYKSGETKTAKLSYTIKDNAGNTTSCSKTANVYVDKVDPTCGNINPKAGFWEWRAGPITYKQSCSDSGSGCTQSTYSTKLDDADYGVQNIYDNAGNTYPCLYYAYVDSSAPYTPYLDGNMTVSVSGNGSASISYKCSSNKKTTTGDNRCTITVNTSCQSGRCSFPIYYTWMSSSHLIGSPESCEENLNSSGGWVQCKDEVGHRSGKLYITINWR